MTPEERAEALARAGACGQGTTEQRAKVSAAIRAAVEEEREACAAQAGNMADQVSIRPHVTAFDALVQLADAIRARA